MPEAQHRWLTRDEIDGAKLLCGALRSDAILLRVLSDLEAAKALLRESVNTIRWMSNPDFQGCTPSTIGRKKDLLDRIREVPGVVDAGKEKRGGPQCLKRTYG